MTMLRSLDIFPLLDAPDLPFSRFSDLSPTVVHNEDGAFPTGEEHLSEYVQLESPNHWTFAHTQF